MNIKQAISTIPQVILAIRKQYGEVSHQELEYLGLTATAYNFFFESVDGDTIMFRGECFDLSLINEYIEAGAYRFLESQNVKVLIDPDSEIESIEYSQFARTVCDIAKFVRSSIRFLNPEQYKKDCLAFE